MVSQIKSNPSLDERKAGEVIRYLLGDSSLGLILVASSENGVSSILIGEYEELLIDDLGRRFPEALLVRGNKEEDRHLLGLVLAFAEDPSRGLDVPLDIRGTDFQRRVWQALRDIPVGETSSFTDIAHKIGDPKAMRAVGNACSTNNLALAIPCHRVLHRDGSLSGGFHWGDARQRILLDREAAAATGSLPGPGSGKA
jgi:AraC family transcriptional regulator, regulatory protein of adaptative response / methylated-DNA-[protein]-cysteine methyltransferase